MDGTGVLSIPCSTGERILLNLDALDGTLVDRFAGLGLSRKILRAAYEFGYRQTGPNGEIYAALNGKAYRTHFNNLKEKLGWTSKQVGRLRGLFVKVRNGHIVDFGRLRGRCEVAAGMRYVAGLPMTDHAIEQANARHISMDQIEAALNHGTVSYECGSQRHAITRRAIQAAMDYHGLDLRPYAGVVVITGDNEADGDAVCGEPSSSGDDLAYMGRVIITVYRNKKYSGARRTALRPNRRNNGRFYRYNRD